jgi:hypothetical protein
MSDFPEFDVFQDYKGKEVRFIYNLFDAGNIFSLRAREDTKNDYAREFTAYDSKNPFNALLKMRNKIKEELNKRYFTEERGKLFEEMNFDYFRGNITYDSQNSEACLIIDGKKMSMCDLERIIASHEGFQIEIRITEE